MAVPAIDRTTATAARMYDYLLGGTENFEVDREAAEHGASAYVGGLDTARAIVRANRRFLGRTVHYLTGEVGVRQFLDIGTGIPTEGNVCQIARVTAPDVRVVHVDNDPSAIAHAQVLLRDAAEGSTAFVDGDLLHPERILREAARTFDLGHRPGDRRRSPLTTAFGTRSPRRGPSVATQLPPILVQASTQASASRSTVILTTQYIEEADRLAADLVVLRKGVIIARGSPDALKDRIADVEVVLQFALPEEADRFVRAALHAYAGVGDGGPLIARGAVTSTGVSARWVGNDSFELARAAMAIADRLDLRPVSVEIVKPSLEDAFLALLRSEL